MVVLKKASVLLSTAALSIGLLAPVASATTVDERMERLPIQVAQTNTKVTKKDLINRMKELFPTEFSGLTEKDFYMNTGYPYPGDSTVRYELSFSKQVKEQHIYGSLILQERTCSLNISTTSRRRQKMLSSLQRFQKVKHSKSRTSLSNSWEQLDISFLLQRGLYTK